MFFIILRFVFHSRTRLSFLGGNEIGLPEVHGSVVFRNAHNGREGISLKEHETRDWELPVLLLPCKASVSKCNL